MHNWAIFRNLLQINDLKIEDKIKSCDSKVKHIS